MSSIPPLIVMSDIPSPRPAYPILLDLSGRLIVLVGGGAVAARKARGSLDAGAARVRCVSPAFHANMPAEVERVAGVYDPRHLDGAGLVFACTDLPAVNDAVVRDARARGLWVNRADSDDEQPGNFTVPAKWRDGPVTITISAGSPALAAFIRDRLAERWDRRWTAMAAAMQILRPMILASGLTPGRRAEAFRDLASDAAIDLFDREGLEAVLGWMRSRYLDFPEQKTDGR